MTTRVVVVRLRTRFCITLPGYKQSEFQSVNGQELPRPNPRPLTARGLPATVRVVGAEAVRGGGSQHVRLRRKNSRCAGPPAKRGKRRRFVSRRRDRGSTAVPGCIASSQFSKTGHRGSRRWSQGTGDISSGPAHVVDGGCGAS